MTYAQRLHNGKELSPSVFGQMARVNLQCGGRCLERSYKEAVNGLQEPWNGKLPEIMLRTEQFRET